MGVNALKFGVVFFVFLAMVLSVFAIGCSASDEKEVAESAVDEAGEAMVEAYNAVLEAEEAGANVSGLLDMLDVAAECLASADVCLRVGDFGGAVGNASFCVEASDGLVDDAGVLRDRALREWGERSWMAVGGSVVGVVVVVCGCWLGWSLFKKRYYERVLEMRPEVVEGES